MEMKFGVILPNYGAYASADLICRAALECEALGYNSAWTTDHIILPLEFRDEYGNTYESLSTLAFLSGVTKRITLGSSIIVVPMRNPVYLAKQIATIDSFSGGRLIIGAAAGYMEQEFIALGANFNERGKIFDESLGVMRNPFGETTCHRSMVASSIFMIWSRIQSQKIPAALRSGSAAIRMQR
jgi:alkanesulfonate monooxygenase SsuD/methylene tetrahydromethanopterin reductase-like flavin-dependent oxidoreductase (luciferase family)